MLLDVLSWVELRKENDIKESDFRTHHNTRTRKRFLCFVFSITDARPAGRASKGKDTGNSLLFVYVSHYKFRQVRWRWLAGSESRDSAIPRFGIYAILSSNIINELKRILRMTNEI